MSVTDMEERRAQLRRAEDRTRSRHGGGTLERDGQRLVSRAPGHIAVPTSDGMARDIAREQASTLGRYQEIVGTMSGLLARWHRRLHDFEETGMSPGDVTLLREEMAQVNGVLRSAG
jgi:hypothetical protein